MPQPKKGPRLGSNPAHQKLMMANLAGSLFEHERIRTTEAKAKALRPFAEKLITKAKKGDVHNRRQVLAVIEDRDVVHKLFDDIAPRFADRNGGYTRILKIGPRNGDGAPMVLVELVAEATREAATTVETPEGKKRRIARRSSRRGKPEDAAAETAATADEDVAGEPELELEADEDADADAEADAEAGGDATSDVEAQAEGDPAEAEAAADGEGSAEAGADEDEDEDDK